MINIQFSKSGTAINQFLELFRYETSIYEVYDVDDVDEGSIERGSGVILNTIMPFDAQLVQIYSIDRDKNKLEFKITSNTKEINLHNRVKKGDEISVFLKNKARDPIVFLSFRQNNIN